MNKNTLNLEPKRVYMFEERTFSSKISATFDFISENFKHYLKYFAYMLLPVSAIQALSMNTFVDNITSGMANATDHEDYIWGMLGSYALTIITTMIGSLLCMSITFTLLRIYNSKKKRLNDLDNSGFMDEFRYVTWQLVKLGVVLFLLIGCVVAAVTGLGIMLGNMALIALLALFYIAMLIVSIPLQNAMPIYVFEDGCPLLEAITRSLSLGFKTWGGMFATVLVLGIISYFIYGISTMPWYIMMVAKGMLANSDGASAIVNSPLYGFVSYIFALVQAFCMYLGMAILHTGIAIQYGHAAEKYDHMSIAYDVEEFELYEDPIIEDIQ